MILIHPHIGDADSDHVMKVVTAKFLACETALISFIINKNQLLRDPGNTASLSYTVTSTGFSRASFPLSSFLPCLCSPTLGLSLSLWCTSGLGLLLASVPRPKPVGCLPRRLLDSACLKLTSLYSLCPAKPWSLYQQSILTTQSSKLDASGSP